MKMIETKIETETSRRAELNSQVDVILGLQLRTCLIDIIKVFFLHVIEDHRQAKLQQLQDQPISQQ